MEIAEHLSYLESQGTRLADAAERAGLDADVPSCPEWTVRDLVTHIGGVHRWAAAIAGRALSGPDCPEGEQVGSGPPDAEVCGWFRDGHRALIETLRAAPADLDCWSFNEAPTAVGSWARRQAHETAIHRADTELAAGGSPSYDVAFALDGIDELLTVFGRRRKEFEPAVLRLEPAEGDPWRLELTDTGAIAGPTVDHEAVAATISGGASELYLWLWNRPANATVTGDHAAAEQWRKVRVRWS